MHSPLFHAPPSHNPPKSPLLLIPDHSSLMTPNHVTLRWLERKRIELFFYGCILLDLLSSLTPPSNSSHSRAAPKARQTKSGLFVLSHPKPLARARRRSIARITARSSVLAF